MDTSGEENDKVLNIFELFNNQPMYIGTIHGFIIDKFHHV